MADRAGWQSAVESELRAVGRGLEVPPASELTAAVRQRLEGRAVRRRHVPTLGSGILRRRLGWRAALVVVVAFLAVPDRNPAGACGDHDRLPCQEPFPGLGQPAAIGHLRPRPCSARHARPRSATAAITGPAGTLAGPGALLRSSPPGRRSRARRRPGVSRDGPGRPRPAAGVTAAAAPSSSSKASRSAASRSSAAKTFIVSPVPHLQPPGQGSGPAACNGHRQPQPDARHCERHDHGDGDDQAGGRALLR
jgi:hypothetical protein